MNGRRNKIKQGGGMKKILIGLIVVLGIFMGCAVEKHTYHGSSYYNPNWFLDGKVVYLENYDRYRIERYFPFGDKEITLEDSWYVCEMNGDGSGKKRIVRLPFEWNLGGSHPCVSATNDKIVLGNGSDGIWVLNRDGSGLKKIVEDGCYPDFNPEGTKVVYEKPKEGIWIYDLTTGKDSCIISDTLAMMPAWSPDGGKIAYVRGETVLGLIYIQQTFQNSFEVPHRIRGLDWMPDSKQIKVTYAWINIETGEVIEDERSAYKIAFDGRYGIYSGGANICRYSIETGETVVILETYTEEE